MNKVLNIVPRWLPSVLMMLIIFGFSSRTSNELPNFGGWDYFVKKTAHGIGYGLLALSYLYALPNRNYKLAWFLAVLYSLTDELHQSLVPGRTPSLIDVFVFDNLGALITLFIHWRWLGILKPPGKDENSK
ncbi:MAG TPA: VanZ family protein [Anaerolineales bacterium]|nr:VanZ family protein [Anaerolineales bacterium]